MQRIVYLDIISAISTSGATLSPLLNLHPLDLFIQSAAMLAAHRLIQLNVWGNSGRGEHKAVEELLRKLNPVFAMFSDSRHLFGRRYEVIFKRDEPEECVSGYTDVFYTDGSKTEHGFGAGVPIE